MVSYGTPAQVKVWLRTEPTTVQRMPLFSGEESEPEPGTCWSAHDEEGEEVAFHVTREQLLELLYIMSPGGFVLMNDTGPRGPVAQWGEKLFCPSTAYGRS